MALVLLIAYFAMSGLCV